MNTGRCPPIYNCSELYLYEIIEDFKASPTQDLQKEIFRSFCSCLWASQNKRKTYTKAMSFKVRKDLLNTELGQLFAGWSRVEYNYYKKTADTKGWKDMLRQRTNNIYTRYFDREIILSPEYMTLLKTPKSLYYSWIQGASANVSEVSRQIEEAMEEASRIRERLQKEKMSLPWKDYKKLTEDLLFKAFANCRLLEDYESVSSFSGQVDFLTEDHFYVKYFGKCLEGGILNYQKKYYGVRSHKAYGRCIDCGFLFERKANNQRRCPTCQASYNRYNKTQKQKKYRVEKLK